MTANLMKFDGKGIVEWCRTGMAERTKYQRRRRMYDGIHIRIVEGYQLLT